MNDDPMKNEALENWMRFFNARTEEEFMKVAQTSSAINEAWEILKELSNDEHVRAVVEARDKLLIELAQININASREERQEKWQSAVKNLLLANIPHDVIADAADLSLDKVKQLAAEIEH